MKCSDLLKELEKLAPQEFAESWDNPGLIIGDEKADIKKVLVALDVTDEVIDEAIGLGADIIVTHHPLIFSSIKQINSKTPLGRKILKLTKNGIAHFALHTNLDTVFGGTNDELASIIGLCDVKVLVPAFEKDGVEHGLGRIGNLPNEATLEEVAVLLKEKLGLSNIRIIGEKCHIIKRIGLCTGSGIDFMKDAVKAGADLFITGDVRYHESQNALDLGISLIDATHYGSENIIVPVICRFIEGLKSDIKVIRSAVDGQVFKDV